LGYLEYSFLKKRKGFVFIFTSVHKVAPQSHTSSSHPSSFLRLLLDKFLLTVERKKETERDRERQRERQREREISG